MGSLICMCKLVFAAIIVLRYVVTYVYIIEKKISEFIPGCIRHVLSFDELSSLAE